MNPSGTTRRRLAAGALGILLLVNASAAPNPNNAKVDKLFAQWDRKGSPGAAIVVVKDGRVVYQRGYGYANLEHKIPITPQTRFDVASVAKQFTGLAVAILIEQGKLSLDDDVRKYLPDVPDFGKPITLGHLMHHTSGLRDWPEAFRLSGVDSEAPISFEMILELVRRQRELDFATGEEFQYSNTGYNLLAATVAKVTGKSFRLWTDANLFQPLDMKHTMVCDDSNEIVPGLAESYAASGGGKFHRAVSQLSAQGSSSIFASAEDMGKWLLNYETAKVGGKSALELMRLPGKLNNGAKVEYGFGISLGTFRNIPALRHSGSWAGFRSATMVLPEKRFAVAVLANSSNMDAVEQSINIADVYLEWPRGDRSGKKASSSRAAVRAEPATWDALLGTYRLGPAWLLTITREGDTLMTQATREDKFKMTPTGTNTFLVEAYSNQQVEFVRQESGAVTNLLYRGINAPKLDLPEMTPDRLTAYVGDYWSEELGVVGRIEIHDGQLATHHRSGTWLHFLPTSQDRFDADFGGWALQFTRNAAGEVTEAKISGGRVRNIRYTRTPLPQTKL